MDSGSVVAVGKEILNSRGDGPLATFSAARRRPTNDSGDIDCPESQAIYAASSMSSISPTLIHPDQIDHAYETLTTDFDEPFDGVFTMLHAIFLAAHDRGLRVVLDGGGGDMVLHEGSYILRLIRKGQLNLAIAEIFAEHKYWGGSPALGLLRYARSAMLPELVKKPVRAFRYRRDYRGYVKTSLISTEFAQSVSIEERIERMRILFPTGSPSDYAVEYCDRIWPNMTAGRERYARIAAATGMEARDPFMDRRVIDYCSRLPGRFFLKDGWPKRILREITADTLPKEVLWTGRKPHLGWLYSDEVTRLAMNRGELDLPLLKEQLTNYVDTAALTGAWQEFQGGGDAAQIDYAHILALWLHRNATRPVVT
jgi:asparagine synthase (glutamine-hydrolysing)